jgi:hypothetical protein
MRRLLPALCLALAVAACTSTASTTSTTSVTSPTPAVTTETFSGTVDVGGRAFNPFTIALSGGQVNVILTAAGPPSTIYMGLGVGTYDGTACTLLSGGSVVTPAGTSAQLVGTLNAGAYCVMVYDAGNQTASITYAVTVNHY